ncbi:RadC-like JAB domain-containing protein [Halanaerobium congolense]|uniref:RadC-like JAB domain-containing protein n=2 Tax=Halanaerobium congolense TaxID=54121 RepID=A0A4R8GIV8_9FIRM|nr:JAB domain-containing protein [Halanaerobium congolense]TDX42251.1 RadC-like JAB domain-containing protein [Halanaerobium congolense]
MLKNKIIKSADSIDIFIKVLKINKKTEVVGMITLDYYNRMTAVVELMHGKNAFKKIGTDDLFNKAFMLDAFSIILAYNSPQNIKDIDNKYYKFNKFLFIEADRLQMDIKDHLIILDKNSCFSLKNNCRI